MPERRFHGKRRFRHQRLWCPEEIIRFIVGVLPSTLVHCTIHLVWPSRTAMQGRPPCTRGHRSGDLQLHAQVAVQDGHRAPRTASHVTHNSTCEWPDVIIIGFFWFVRGLSEYTSTLCPQPRVAVQDGHAGQAGAGSRDLAPTHPVGRPGRPPCTRGHRSGDLQLHARVAVQDSHARTATLPDGSSLGWECYHAYMGSATKEHNHDNHIPTLLLFVPTNFVMTSWLSGQYLLAVQDGHSSLLAIQDGHPAPGWWEKYDVILRSTTYGQSVTLRAQWPSWTAIVHLGWWEIIA
ncbi:hypothetical protein EDD15DRAFT_2205059 [Pisolithus albus]|nr:hypothetical protein EDD15DRAFT_2205059 [Pisolithus albus]